MFKPEQSTGTFPALVAFDLDYTLWPTWMEVLVGPLHRDGDTLNEIIDSQGIKVHFFKDTAEILHQLRDRGTPIAACSRTTAGELAHQALELLLVPPELAPSVAVAAAPEPSSKDSEVMPAIKFFDHVEIYPGSKINHFTKIHQVTGIPFSDMLFFDDEEQNSEVQKKLGVTFCLVAGGLSKEILVQGLEKWRQRNSKI